MAIQDAGNLDVTAVNPNGVSTALRATGRDDVNSTSTPLAANGVFTGTWKDVINFSCLTLSVKSDVASIDGGLRVEHSTNGIDFDAGFSEFTVFDDHALQFAVPVHSFYYRIVYTNGPVAQTTFRLLTKLHILRPGPTSRPLSRFPLSSDIYDTTRAVATVKNPSGTGFNDWPIATDGSPKVAIANIQQDVLLRPLTNHMVYQIPVATIATRIDSQQVTSRRYVSIQNDGPNRIAFGFSNALTFNTGHIVAVGAVKSFSIDNSNTLWGVSEGLVAGTQTTLTRSGTTTSGTASNPGNALSSNNVYATLNSNAQTVTVSGFTAGTTNPLTSVRIGIEASKTLVVTNTVTYQGITTGADGNSINVVTILPVPAVSGQFYLVAVSRENTAADVLYIVGLGLTWVQVSSSTNPSNRRVDIWRGVGTPTVTENVSAQFSATATNCHIAVTRYTNVDPSSPVLDSKTSTGNSNAPSTSALNVVNKGMVFFAAAMDGNSMAAGASYTLRSTETQLTGSRRDGLGTQTKAITTTGTDIPSATIASSVQWATAAVSLQPSGATDPTISLNYALSGVNGTGTNVTVSSTTDTVVYFNITDQKGWVYSDIPNLAITATANSLNSNPVNIDQIFLELVDTTGSISRISFWQGGRPDVL